MSGEHHEVKVSIHKTRRVIFYINHPTEIVLG